MALAVLEPRQAVELQMVVRVDEARQQARAFKIDLQIAGLRLRRRDQAASDAQAGTLVAVVQKDRPAHAASFLRRMASTTAGPVSFFTRASRQSSSCRPLAAAAARWSASS